MAAGKGERMLHLTRNRPKALIEISGKYLISYTLEQIRRRSERIFITVGDKGNQVMDFMSTQGEFHFIRTDGKGNAWWIYNSILKEVDEPVLVFPCDIITRIDFDFICRNYQKSGFPVCLLIPVATDERIEGDYIFGEYGKVTFLSRNRASPIYCSGIQVINPYRTTRITGTGIDDFSDLWNWLIEKDQLYYSDIYPYRWFSVNTPEQLKTAEKILSVQKDSPCTFT